MITRVSAHPPSTALRAGLACLILICASGLFYLLGCRFLSEYHQFRAKFFFEKKYYGVAENHLRAAAAFQPRDGRIHQTLGELYFELAGIANTPSRSLSTIVKAKDQFLKAAQSNPLDAGVFFRLGKTVAQIEAEERSTGTTSAEGGQDPPARFYFQEAVRLRPNGILYNYALLHDLARHGQNAAMARIARTLVGGYPPIFAGLKQKKFWTPELETACIEGLHRAIENNRYPKQAYIFLSQWMAEKKDWARSISLYRNALGVEPDKNTPSHYLHLGRLYIHAEDMKGAAEQFVNSLVLSTRPDATLEQIHRIYRVEKRLEEFDPFFIENRDRFFFSHRADILHARYSVELKRYDKAREILESVNLHKPRAEAYYWLARIAEIEKDWDRMELAIHKATVYDPRNAHYHRVFASLLRKIKKTDRAEREAALAEEYR